MKNLIRNKIFITLLCALPVALSAQESSWEPFTREVNINAGDSLLIARIMINHENIKTNDNLIYFWYHGGKINSNAGDFAGELLHGVYLTYDNHKNLITKGYFYYGLKDGTWKYWYPDGKLKRVVNWNKGRMDGISRIYNKDGTLIRTLEYRNGQLKGFPVFAKNNTKEEKATEKTDTKKIQPPEQIKSGENSGKTKTDTVGVENKEPRHRIFDWLKKSKDKDN